jgi:hypothetical protein
MQDAPHDVESLSDVLAALKSASNRAEVLSVRDILTEIGDRSFATVLLVPALLLVSPLSAIPGTPTIGAILIILIVLQWLMGRRHLWFPETVMRRSIKAERVRAGAHWLERPAGWIDSHARQRLVFLTRGPLSLLPLFLILIIAATWPVLELLPMVTSIGAFTVTLFAFGLMTKDGLWIALGYGFVGLLVTVASFLV